MKILIDFDGVIHDFKNPIQGRRIGAPIEGTKESLQSMKSRGFEIVIFTVWGDEKGQKTIRDFMNYYELPFDSVTNIKENADWYIDDKAIHFDNWQSVLQKLC
jgi:hypothetical protein